jgi:hypothetical protein
MCGFTRVLTQRDQDNGGDVSEGKDAMSVDIYFALCRWFLDKGTLEGVWCHCFLLEVVITWNLMCFMNHITWYIRIV